MENRELKPGKYIIPLSKGDRRAMAPPRMFVWVVPLLFALFALIAQLVLFRGEKSAPELSWILWIGVPPTVIAALWWLPERSILIIRGFRKVIER